MDTTGWKHIDGMLKRILSILCFVVLAIGNLYAGADTLMLMEQDTAMYCKIHGIPWGETMSEPRYSPSPKKESGEPAITLTTYTEDICTANPFFSFRAEIAPGVNLGARPNFLLEYSSSAGYSWEPFYQAATSSHILHYTQRPANLPIGWYRVLAARYPEDLANPNARIESEPIELKKVNGGCTPFKHPWPDEISDNVCPHGTLLFREDFGGNDPSDPVTSQTPLTTMSNRYTQVYNVISRVNSRLFVVAKHGWQNNINTSQTANLYSQWFIQDDHTYPNDYTRGYLLEVDAVAGNSDAFYTTTIPVCDKLDLSFSAYVANVLEPGHNFARPKLRFVITDESTGNVIMEQSTGDVSPAPSDYGVNGPPTVQSAPWHLVGASFTVPDGVGLIRLSIYNDVNTSMGNDFAMDDIEIRLCKPEVTIESEVEVCLDSAYTFKANVTSDGGFKQPYQYLWQFAKDSLPYNSNDWINKKRGLDFTIDKVTADDEGWYRLCVTSDGVDVETERYCRAVSEPFHLTVVNCAPPVFPQYEVVSPAWACVDSAYCIELDTLNKADFAPIDYTYWWEYSSDDKKSWTKATDGQSLCFSALTAQDSCWYRLGFHYVDKYNDITDYYEPFLLNVEDCTPPTLPDLSIADPGWLCRDSAYCFVVDTLNKTTFTPSEYTYYWETSPDGLDNWTKRLDGLTLCMDNLQQSDSLWYRVTAHYKSRWHDLSASSLPVLLQVVDCTPAIPPSLQIVSPEYICIDSAYFFALDTLNKGTFDEMEYDYTWEFSKDNVTWTERAKSEFYFLPAVTAADSGYYRVRLTYQSLYWSVDVVSPSFFLHTDDCTPPPLPMPVFVSDHVVCQDSAYCFEVNISNAAAIPDTARYNFRWEFSRNSRIWATYATDLDLCLPAVSEADSGWYRLVVSYEYPAVEGMYITRPFRLDITHCAPPDDPVDPVDPHDPDKPDDPHNPDKPDEPEVPDDDKTPPVELKMDTTVCDTLMPLTWRDRIWLNDTTVTDTITRTNGTDSVYLHLKLNTIPCCPDFQTLQLDTLVCDTLLPFVWQFGDTALTYTEPEYKQITIPHRMWANCAEIVYTLNLDTCFCERLYPLIVNKYNWLILCDNTRMAEFFPDRQVKQYRWFKNGELIDGAVEDDYSEREELCGIFQLYLTLDNDQVIKSNILYINTSEQPEQLIARYNRLGWQIDHTVPMTDLPAGLYINVYQCGETLRAEKVLVGF